MENMNAVIHLGGCWSVCNQEQNEHDQLSILHIPLHIIMPHYCPQVNQQCESSYGASQATR